MSKKNTITIKNGLTGKTREVALPGRAEQKPAKPTSEGGKNVQRKS